MQTGMKRLAAAGLAVLAAGCADAPKELVAPGHPRMVVTSINLYCPGTMQVGQSNSCSGSVQVTDPADNSLPRWWASSNPSVVQVTGWGGLTAVGPGSATISLNVGSQWAYATINVPYPQPPLSLSISGPTSVPRQGQYLWNAQVSNQQGGETVYYSWEESTNGGASWTTVASGASYYRNFTSSSASSFLLRVSAVSSINRSPSSSTASVSVSVTSPLPPPLLTVYADGPDYVQVAGTFTWTGYPSGGSAPYSYAWEYSPNGYAWYTLYGSYGPAYSQSVQKSFSCGASDYLRYRVRVTSGDGQTAYGYRNTNVYVAC